jgi:hypothetical protein
MKNIFSSIAHIHTKNTKASMESVEQHSQTETRPMSFLSRLEAKQTPSAFWNGFDRSLRFDWPAYSHSLLYFTPQTSVT